MSRIGRTPVTIPAGVEVKVSDENVVTVKGPKGTLTQPINKNIQVTVEDGVVRLIRSSDEPKVRALHGLSRTLIHNMVVGVTEGYKKELEINGVGYRATKEGKKLVMSLGYSHPVVMEEVDGIKIDVPAPNRIVVTGIDKQLVGQFAADIRSKKPPEPYKGKGIKYVGEVIRRKEGKTGAKK